MVQNSELCEYHGGCHCGTVRYKVLAPASVEVEDCNCSMCRKSGYLHLIVPKNRFQLLSGRSDLTCYTFNTGAAKHYFCRTCGIKSFYIPRSNPDGVDVNLRCLDVQPANVSIVAFDGQNWEHNAHRLRDKSRE